MTDICVKKIDKVAKILEPKGSVSQLDIKSFLRRKFNRILNKNTEKKLFM